MPLSFFGKQFHSPSHRVPMNAKLLSKLLQTIENNLTDWIPIGVKEIGVKTPAYALFLWYQDYSGEFTPIYGIATQKLLDIAQRTKFEEPLDKFELIWRPQQCANLDIPGQLLVDECDIVETEVENCYEILAEQSGISSWDPVEEDTEDDGSEFEVAEDLESDEDDQVSDEDDEFEDEEIEKELEALAPFREMMHRVGDSLRKIDWKKVMPVTDDFVVIVSDYVGYRLAEDFERCVTDEQYQKLVDAGMVANFVDEHLDDE